MTEMQKHQTAYDLGAKKSAETLFIETIENSGGMTYPLGPISGWEKSSFRSDLNRSASGKVPDIGFSLPGRPLLIAQIHEMRLTSISEESDPCFVLNDDQYNAMIDAANSYHILPVIYCNELEYIGGLSAFSFVSFAEFQKRHQALGAPLNDDGSRLTLSLNALKPLYELFRYRADEKLQMVDYRKRVRVSARDRSNESARPIRKLS